MWDTKIINARNKVKSSLLFRSDVIFRLVKNDERHRQKRTMNSLDGEEKVTENEVGLHDEIGTLTEENE